ncbi:MAG: GNAT family N-acetyltransferase [Clostridia bacterium]
MRWASEHLNARRIEIGMDARNLRSRKVAERAGFHLAAVLLQDEPDVEGLPSDTRPST